MASLADTGIAHFLSLCFIELHFISFCTGVGGFANGRKVKPPPEKECEDESRISGLPTYARPFPRYGRLIGWEQENKPWMQV